VVKKSAPRGAGKGASKTRAAAARRKGAQR
jgi:hypothetical protein